MKTRFQLRREKKGKSFDPLVIEEFDWDNEWADSSHVFPRGRRGCGDIDENDLTWQLVDEAIGASSSLRGRNLPRTANKRSRNSNTRLVEIDSGSGNEEEEEEHQDLDPLDDEDVTDCEDEPSNGSNAGEEDIEAAATNVDEFDDGY
jgi:hypothetical protein